MARYSPELLAALRTRYEQTDQPMNALAAHFGIGITTLQTLVRKNGWTPRSQRVRHCPPGVQLHQEAEALTASLPPPERGRSHGEAVRVGVDAESNFEATPTHKMTPSPTLPLSGGGSEALPAAAAVHASAPSLSKAERLEALVEKEIAAEEATRAALGIRPRSRNEAERCARTISKLTQTLQALQKLRGDGRAGGSEQDEPPRDMDAFREQLARRIEAFVKAEIGPERMAMNQQVAGVTDDELKALIEVGRERGMQALLQPAPSDADNAVPADARLAATEN